MEEKILKVINHYGVNHQQRKFAEETFELQEVITAHELSASSEYDMSLAEFIGLKEHIAEEIADCMFLLEQFKCYYGITSEEITDIFWKKVDRTLERMEMR